jgi:uncharacterized protein YecE (DUF72 family)
LRAHEIRVGCAGWSIPKEHAGEFPGEGSHLARYARRLPAVEINSSFYRPHRPSTYARWAAETPEGFAFAAKVPREVTHVRRLVGADEPLDRFLAEFAALGSKRGPILVQLPPSLGFDTERVGGFFSALRRRYDGPMVCEPRHRTWFEPEADNLLAGLEVARAAADPAVVPRAAEPGGWGGLVYYRLHGSPRMYYSDYTAEDLERLEERLSEVSRAVPAWCIFDNTALGAATANALWVWDRLREQDGARA